MSDQLDRIEQKLDQLLANQPKPRTPNTNSEGELDLTPLEVRRERVTEIERLFITILNSSAEKSYKLPRYLKCHPLKPIIEALPVATLINQASLRKVFRLRAPSDPTDSTPAQRAKAALEDSNLTIVTASATKMDTTANTKLALSPAEVLESTPVYDHPDTFVGWSTSDRVEPYRSIIDDSVVNPHPDPSGTRDWEVKDKPEKKIRKVRLGS